MIRIRTSTLEQYRLLVEEDFVDLKEFIAYIRNGQEGVANEKMKIGSAWHKVLEDPEGTRFTMDVKVKSKVEVREYNRSGDYFFDGPAVRDAVAMIGPGVREKEWVKPITTSIGTIELKGTTDWQSGLVVQDAKTKINKSSSGVTAEDYEDSLQWRIYLWLTDCMEFRYNLFPTWEPRENGYVEIRDTMAWLSFSFFRYDDMESEILRWVEEFLSWCQLNNLLPFLDRKGS